MTWARTGNGLAVGGKRACNPCEAWHLQCESQALPRSQLCCLYRGSYSNSRIATFAPSTLENDVPLPERCHCYPATSTLPFLLSLLSHNQVWGFQGICIREDCVKEPSAKARTWAPIMIQGKRLLLGPSFPPFAQRNHQSPVEFVSCGIRDAGNCKPWSLFTCCKGKLTNWRDHLFPGFLHQDTHPTYKTSGSTVHSSSLSHGLFVSPCVTELTGLLLQTPQDIRGGEQDVAGSAGNTRGVCSSRDSLHPSPCVVISHLSLQVHQ